MKAKVAREIAEGIIKHNFEDQLSKILAEINRCASNRVSPRFEVTIYEDLIPEVEKYLSFDLGYEVILLKGGGFKIMW